MAATIVMNVTDFKAKCLALFDEVEAGKISINVTRRGKTIAIISPPQKRGFKSPLGSWAGRMEIVGDIVNTNFQWEPLRKEARKR